MYCYEAMSTDGNENHHILPKKLFPEFKNFNKNNWNCARLPYRDHYIAHYLLCKVFPKEGHHSCLRAFNQMQRVKNVVNISELADLYSEFRESLAKSFSEINKGRKPTAEQLKKLSESMKGRVVVYDKTVPIEERINFMTDVTDPDYISGKLVVRQTGTKHTKETKIKMSDNGIKGCTAYHNETEIIYLNDGETIPHGFVKGLPDSHGELTSERFSGTIHYHNPITKETLRLHQDEVIPDGFIKGRLKDFHNPFRGTMLVKNHLTNETTLQPKSEEYDFMHSGVSSKVALIHNGYFTLTVDRITKIFPHITWNTIKFMIYEPEKIINHHRLTSLDRETMRPYKTYGEFPLQVISVQELIKSGLHEKYTWIP
jgi:hypothetical protein